MSGSRVRKSNVLKSRAARRSTLTSRPDKTVTVIWKIFQIVLWLGAAAYAVAGLLAITGVLRSAREAHSLRHAYAVFGSVVLIIGVTSAVVPVLAHHRRRWLALAPPLVSRGLPAPVV